MTNLLLFVALATIIVLIIILAKTFKEKNVLKEDLKESQETINYLDKQLNIADNSYDKIIKHVKELNNENKNLKKQVEVFEEALIGKSELIDEITSKHTDYLLTMQDLADENKRLKQHIEQLTTSIPVNKIETKSKKNRRV